MPLPSGKVFVDRFLRLTGTLGACFRDPSGAVPALLKDLRPGRWGQCGWPSRSHSPLFGLLLLRPNRRRRPQTCPAPSGVSCSPLVTRVTAGAGRRHPSCHPPPPGGPTAPPAAHDADPAADLHARQGATAPGPGAAHPAAAAGPRGAAVPHQGHVRRRPGGSPQPVPLSPSSLLVYVRQVGPS